VPSPSNLTLGNFTAVNSRIDLLTGLLNSGLFTGGVLICTVVFGVLVGYALAVLEWRGRGVTFALVLLVQVIPFQLLQIPLYVLVARDYGLADNVLGMILPFAINSTAVIVFRQYFLQVPKELFEAARIDGANEIRLLWSVAIPLVRPAMVTALLLTFIGPWNEFLWPFLITKQADRQPRAVSLANYISAVASSTANPFGAVTAGALVLAVPVVVLFIVFQRYFVSSDLGSGVKG
jgi:multiple sugar transport system permease protein